MANPAVSRRNLLRGGLALAGACALDGTRRAHARGVPERPTLVVLWLNGGPAGLFNSAGSFYAKPCVTRSRVAPTVGGWVA
jgi:uncharacterized protein (DUF1501 family)